MASKKKNSTELSTFCTQEGEYPIFQEECGFIERRRMDMNEGRQAGLIDDHPTTKNNLVGLCLSGGGIRSATFNLGFMQALYKHRILQRVDYLSTVSGGGYIGSCLTSLLSSGSKPKATIHDDTEKTEKDSAIQNTLDPGKDSASIGQDAEQKIKDLWHDQNFPFANPFSAKAEDRQIRVDPKKPGGDDPAERAPVRHLRYYSNYLTAEGGLFQKYLGPVLAFVRGLLFNLMMIFPILLISAALLAAMYQIPEVKLGPVQINSTIEGLKAALEKQQLAKTEYEVFVYRHTQEVFDLDTADRVELVQQRPDLRSQVKTLGNDIENADAVVRSHWLVMMIFPLAVLAIMMAYYMVLFVGDSLRRKEIPLETRFKLSQRFSQWLFVGMSLWGIQAFGAAMIYWEHFNIPDKLAFVSLLTFLGPKLLKKDSSTTGKGKKPWVKIVISMALMALTPLMLLYLLGVCVNFLMCGSGSSFFIFQWLPFIGDIQAPWNSIGMAFLLGVILLVFTNNLLNINKFSLHNFYRDRLCRAYIFQADPEDKLTNTPFERVVSNDPIKLSAIYNDDGPIVGPYHIINANLNLKKDPPNYNGKNAIFRKGESFIFSKYRCGSEKTGYISTQAYENADGHIDLGTAMAISGAAANIGMGQGDMPTFRLLMGLLNIRLGYWALNPKRFAEGASNRGLKKAPGTWEGLCEWIGWYTLKEKYINLSDGGHFDNIGVYELLRRRCKYIIVGDAEADPEMKFQALANLIRMALIDFSIIIDIDISGLKKDNNKPFSGQHCAMGTIKYPQCGALDEEIGYLFYCKSSLTGDEPAHLDEYRVKHPDFPHQTTADQWFDEKQFEVYRELGFHVGYWSFHSAAEIKKTFNMEELFVQIKQFWRPRSTATEERFTQHAAELNRIFAHIKKDQHLSFIDAQMYPEWDEMMAGSKNPPRSDMWLPEGAEERRAGFYICNQMIQLMENVYLDLDLEKQYAHPDNRGWMNLFMHWAWAGIFRVTWAISGCTCGAKFQKFCERRLHLGESHKITAQYLTLKVDGDAIMTEGAKAGEPLQGQAFEAVIQQYLNPFELGIIRDHIGGSDTIHRSCYGFYLTVEDPLTRKPGVRFCFGFALIIPNKDGTQIDYFRIQDHLRRMGLGRLAMEKLVETIVRERDDREVQKDIKGIYGPAVAKHKNLASISLSQSVNTRPELEKGRSKLQAMLTSVVTEIGSD